MSAIRTHLTTVATDGASAANIMAIKTRIVALVGPLLELGGTVNFFLGVRGRRIGMIPGQLAWGTPNHLPILRILQPWRLRLFANGPRGRERARTRAQELLLEGAHMIEGCLGGSFTHSDSIVRSVQV